MKLKIISIALALFFIIMLVPMNTQAGYSMAISGKSDFIVAPFQVQMFNTTDVYVRLYLSEYSQSSLEIDMSVEGSLAEYISFPDYDGTNASFTLFPGQNQRVRYQLNFPASAPGKYYGAILAVGTPPTTEVSEGTGAIGKPAVSINLVVDVPTDVQIFNFQTSREDGFQDGQWSTWGDDWISTLDVINGGNDSFTGQCNLTLSDSTGMLEYEVFNIINLTGNGTLSISKTWISSLALQASYMVTATVYNSTETKDTEMLSFFIPSPAEIISVSQNPETVFWGETVAIYAILASSDSTVTINYRVNNGTDNATEMTYSSTTGEFIASIPSQEIGSMVYYWVTSVNGAFSDRLPSGPGAYSYYVFSPDVPDLTINEDTIQFIPFDPRIENINVTDGDGNPAYITIYFTIGNTGRGDASSVPFAVYDRETEIWSGTVASIAGESNSDFLQFTWSPPEGEHILRFVVDPDNTILELDENNNHYTIDEFTIHGPEPIVSPPPPATTTDYVPYVVIPLILVAVLFLLLFLRNKKTINVTVSEVKPFKHPKKGTTLGRFTCSYGDGIILGPTKSSEMHAEVGTVIQVRPNGLYAKEDGTLAWGNAEVMKVLEDGKPDREVDIRKLIKKEDK